MSGKRLSCGLTEVSQSDSPNFWQKIQNLYLTCLQTSQRARLCIRPSKPCSHQKLSSPPRPNRLQRIHEPWRWDTSSFQSHETKPQKFGPRRVSSSVAFALCTRSWRRVKVWRTDSQVQPCSTFLSYRRQVCSASGAVEYWCACLYRRLLPDLAQLESWNQSWRQEVRLMMHSP